MKQLFTLLFVAFSFSFIQAQIEEGVRSMSQGAHNSLSIDIPEADLKLTKKVWSKYLKSNTKGGKTKAEKKTGVSFTNDTELVAIGGANTIDIYTKFTQVGTSTNVVIWYDMGGAYLNSEMHGDKYTEGEKFLMRFVLAVVIEKTKQELKEEEKKKKGLLKDMSSLKKKNDGYHKDINNAEEKIKTAKANIESNLNEQKAVDTAILDQDGVIEAVKKRLGELEK